MQVAAHTQPEAQICFPLCWDKPWDFPLLLCSGIPSPLLVRWHQWGCPDGYPAASALLSFPSQLWSSLGSSRALSEP